MENNPNFKISSALKSLIGRELITDEYIAIFELVKNSFDANAKNVKIIFENIYSQNSRIVIIDDGKGMDEKDLVEKWLFVAYSAKRDGTENYRDKIKNKRIYAGAKGVGRFSCDRLGSKLNLITKRDAPNSVIENIQVDWEKFEEDSKKEFIHVETTYKRLTKIQYDLKKGTILEISDLRDRWDRESIKKLRRSLEKLINPNQENVKDNFKIEVECLEELKNDKKLDKKEKINGPINNFLFENLSVKTTQIISEVDEKGEFIFTTLIDRGTLIYKIKEKNPYYYQWIKNIKIHLFQLNQSAKKSFTELMGLESVNYGSVFLYKNGFRIYPDGDIGVDVFGIDKRKAQGYNRRLGTRDLIGRIEINGANSYLMETTSRDGGLIKNKAYFELEHFFIEKALRRLERYVVEIIKWGDPYKVNETDADKRNALSPHDVKSKIWDIISNLTNAKEILDVEYDKNFLKILDTNQEKSAKKLLKNFVRMADATDNAKLKKDARLAQKRLNELSKARIEAEKETANVKKDNKLVTEALEQKTQQLRIVTSIASQDLDTVTNLHHQVFIITQTIQNNLVDFSKRNQNSEFYSKDVVNDLISKISLEVSKIESFSKFGIRAIFEDFNSVSENDIALFIKDYLTKISDKFRDKNRLQIKFETNLSKSFNINFRPLDISIIIDNMISNSVKSHAKVLKIILNGTPENCVQLIFEDDGDGLDKSIKIADTIFEKGFSTKKSTGLGLFHVKNIVKENGWKIEISNQVKQGFQIILTIKK
jgi:signal transduction histidine kinase